MGTTNMLLREILQEIREVKTHVIPQSVPVSPPSVISQVPILDPAYVVTEPAMKGVYKGKPRWQQTNTESYVYEFPALSSVAHLSAGRSGGGGGAGGGGGSMGAADFITAMSGWTEEELEAVRSSLRGSVAKPGEERQTRKSKNRRNRTRKN